MIVTDDRKRFGARLQAAREAARLTQLQVASRFGVGKGTVSAWETGRGVPDAFVLRGLARLYGVSADSLLFDPLERTPQFAAATAAVKRLAPEERAALLDAIQDLPPAEAIEELPAGHRALLGQTADEVLRAARIPSPSRKKIA